MGEFLTRATVWVAMLAWGVCAWIRLRAPTAADWSRMRRVWTVGCTAFLAHVICAFSSFHGWSHTQALKETARQTALMTGIQSGFGLYLNYTFAIVWLADCVWWWSVRDTVYQQRRKWISMTLWMFMAFMLFNGSVVFAEGPVRWVGIGMSAGLAVRWIRMHERSTETD